MHDETPETWQPIECAERDRMLHEDTSWLTPYSSLTDPSGQYGEPIVYTEWGVREGEERAVLRDYMWPQSERPCEHYRAVEPPPAGAS